ncbi:MAG TPA: hypothetical protein VF505_08105, partial [Thermoanaerobaculia bacterium]
RKLKLTSSMLPNLERALVAKRESRRVAFRKRFDAGVVKDVVAIANSGGGVIVFDEGPIDKAALGDVDFDIVDAVKDSKPVVALIIEEAPVPIVMNGIVYVRHGAKSEPATTKDLAGVIDRRVSAHRRSWLSAVRSVVQPRQQPALSSEVRDSDSPSATPIRVVTDPRAPAFRVIDYDRTHPYRQKELLAAFRERIPLRPINQFDLLSVRHTHAIDANPDFSHKSLFGTRQYSQRFLEWLVKQAESDPSFFSAARAKYQAGR